MLLLLIKKKICFSEVDIDLAKEYAAEDSDVTFRLWEILKKELLRVNSMSFIFILKSL